MDDVHIAHFAALLRTHSKEKDRQVINAVHDRQLFEYLKLELSPAFPDDSLVTLELVRGPNRDTSCIPDRPPFREEKELLATAYASLALSPSASRSAPRCGRSKTTVERFPHKSMPGMPAPILKVSANTFVEIINGQLADFLHSRFILCAFGFPCS
jgi:hypothetical protein